MGGTLHAVVYVRRSIRLSIRRQVTVCLEVAEAEGLHIVALVAYDGANPADAIRCIEVGEAQVLLTAHPDVLGPAHVRQAITDQVERIGGELCFASITRAEPDRPPMLDLAARMTQQGLQPEQIAAVLRIDVTQAKDLIRRAGKAVCLLVMAVCAWVQERLASAAIATALAAGLVVGETAWQVPSGTPQVPAAPMEQRPAPDRSTPVRPGHTSPVDRERPRLKPRLAGTPSTAPSPTPSPSASPSGSPTSTTPALPLPSCVDLTSPLACTQGLLPTT